MAVDQVMEPVMVEMAPKMVAVMDLEPEIV
jgi:hypothetical protein